MAGDLSPRRMLNAETDRLDDGRNVVGHEHADKDSGDEDERCAHGTCPPKSPGIFRLQELPDA